MGSKALWRKKKNSRITEAEDRISEVEDRMVELYEAERKEKRIKRNEKNLRDLWVNVNCPNIWILDVPEEDKNKRHEKILEKITVKNFPKMGKEIATQVQETQSPKQDKPKAKHKTDVNQLTKIKHKELNTKIKHKE